MLVGNRGEVQPGWPSHQPDRGRRRRPCAKQKAEPICDVVPLDDATMSHACLSEE
jgi:hypothetical protein